MHPKNRLRATLKLTCLAMLLLSLPCVWFGVRINSWASKRIFESHQIDDYRIEIYSEHSLKPENPDNVCLELFYQGNSIGPIIIGGVHRGIDVSFRPQILPTTRLLIVTPTDSEYSVVFVDDQVTGEYWPGYSIDPIQRTTRSLRFTERIQRELGDLRYSLTRLSRKH